MMLDKSAICAVVVTFRPETSVAARLHRLSEISAGLIVVDNGSPPDSVAAVERCVDGLHGHLVANSENLGIAVALNQGMKLARRLGFRWVLLFDQDSNPGAEIVSVMGRVIAEHREAGRIAVLGANYTMAGSGQARYPVGTKQHPAWYEVRTAITSGSLLSVEAYNEIGPFRDEFFIDCVDDDYCLRARRRGWLVVVTRQPVMEHRIGSPRVRRVFGFRVGTSNHSPERYYFGARNCTALLGEYGLTERAWARAVVLSWVKRVLLISAVETDKVRKLKAVAGGVKDALRGRFGDGNGFRAR